MRPRFEHEHVHGDEDVHEDEEEDGAETRGWGERLVAPFAGLGLDSRDETGPGEWHAPA